MQRLGENTEFNDEPRNDLDDVIIGYINEHNLHLNGTSVDQQKDIL